MSVELLEHESRMTAGVPSAIDALGPALIDDAVGRWWLVHTKSRQEKALAEDLRERSIGVFLPLARVRRHYGQRAVQVQVPLFPTYLFMCGDDDARYATLMTHRAAQVIAVADQERLKDELRQVYRVTASEHPVDLYPGLRRGRRCRITGGSLQGVEGVVIRRAGLCRVFLGVEVLSQSAELEIDPEWLEVID